MKLYELAPQYSALKMMLGDAETEEDAAAALAAFEEAEGKLLDKVDGLLAVLAELEALGKAAKEEAARLRDRGAVAEKAAGRLRAYLARNMAASEIKVIDCPRGRVTLRAGKERVVITDADALPTQFREMRVEIVPKKKDILDHYHATGEIVSGVDVVTGEGYVQIK